MPFSVSLQLYIQAKKKKYYYPEFCNKVAALI